jgi:t-SNARE complex subunit (syntaxin)
MNWQDILKEMSLEDYLNPDKWMGNYKSNKISWSNAKKKMLATMDNVPQEHKDFLQKVEEELVGHIERNQESYSKVWREIMDRKISRLFSDSNTRTIKISMLVKLLANLSI